METSEEYDVVIVGGGAAGLSAALVLGRARRRVVVIDAGAPRNAAAAHMQGFLSRDGMSPSELLAVGRREIAGYGVELVDDTVIKLEQTSDGDLRAPLEVSYRLHLVSGTTIDARRVLVTTGASDDVPDLPGIRERWGRDLLHCPYCHGWEVRDEPLGVLGTIPGSIQHALLIRQWSSDVIFFAHTYGLTDAERRQLDARDIAVVTGEVARLVVEEDRLTGVELVDGRIVARSAVFVRPGIHPHPDGLLAGLGCRYDDAGFVVTDSTGRTSNLGVWAAGNVADPRAQVITAAGAGSAAAIAINNDLVQADTDRAIHTDHGLGTLRALGEPDPRPETG
ncbi:MAG TPA: NAD(P)/FAD-dependent oxidoreductase [Aquihabitans sp.]|jgi:thioredoxin reductase|nr:NAD(P)/FAD-dependent oxidoreductase [Aquihabitans sp.]